MVVDNPCLSGGTLELLLEAVMPATLVHMFGDTPIARALAEVGTAAGYEVRTTVDPATTTDPVCGMTVAVAARSPHHDRDGQRWYFCAPGCRDAFAADPDRFRAVVAPGTDGGSV